MIPWNLLSTFSVRSLSEWYPSDFFRIQYTHWQLITLCWQLIIIIMAQIEDKQICFLWSAVRECINRKCNKPTPQIAEIPDAHYQLWARQRTFTSGLIGFLSGRNSAGKRRNLCAAMLYVSGIQTISWRCHTEARAVILIFHPEEGKARMLRQRCHWPWTAQNAFPENILSCQISWIILRVICIFHFMIMQGQKGIFPVPAGWWKREFFSSSFFLFKARIYFFHLARNFVTGWGFWCWGLATVLKLAWTG